MKALLQCAGRKMVGSGCATISARSRDERVACLTHVNRTYLAEI